MEYIFDEESPERIFVLDEIQDFNLWGLWAGDLPTVSDRIVAFLSSFQDSDTECYRAHHWEDEEVYEIHKFVIESDVMFNKRQAALRETQKKRENAAKKNAEKLKNQMMDQPEETQREMYEALKQKFGQ